MRLSEANRAFDWKARVPHPPPSPIEVGFIRLRSLYMAKSDLSGFDHSTWRSRIYPASITLHGEVMAKSDVSDFDHPGEVALPEQITKPRITGCSVGAGAPRCAVGFDRPGRSHLAAARRCAGR